MDKKLGVYIHIPFCASKCGYCDFYSLAGCDNMMGKYENAVIAHIQESASLLSNYCIDTVYFGGGTPSYFGASRICNIFDALKRSGQVLKASEVTVEVNPDSVSRGDLNMLRRAGVNRLSMGAQSANPEILKIIGRRHNWKQVEKAMKAARSAGFDNVSLDLIYGLPSQTKGDWADTLTKALELRPEHLSCYGLKLEEGTPMYKYKDSPFLPDDDEQADMYLYTVETLERYDYPQYEISNFAIAGFESRHNMKYWRLDDYMGFGPGAHSCVDGVRYSFVRDLNRYINGVSHSETDILDEYEVVDKLDKAAEYIMLGMRTTLGISAKEYRDIYRGGFEAIENVLVGFERHGWAKFEKERWHFTSSGFLLSNTLIGELLDAQAQNKLQGTPWMMESLDGDIPKVELSTGGQIKY